MKAKPNFLRAVLLLLPMMLISFAGFAQISVSGSVSSDAGEPLIGVSVVEVGTTNGTITDLDGKFSLKVSEGSEIIFSFMGYQSQTLPASSTMKVVMSEDTFF